MISEYRPPNSTIQEASQYKADIDSSITLLGRIASAFAPHEKREISEVSIVTTVADIGGSLDGTFFTLFSGKDVVQYYVWFDASDISGSNDPGISGATGIQINYLTGDSSTSIATALNTVLDAHADFNSSLGVLSGTADEVTISAVVAGSATDLSDGVGSGLATGFDFIVSTQGGDGPDDLTVHIDAGFVLNDPAASGNNGLEEIGVQSLGDASPYLITAPSTNPRIDRIVLDVVSGVASVVAGMESASPVAPDVPIGKIPNCQVILQTSTTIITNSLITDERPVVSYGVRVHPRVMGLSDAAQTLDSGHLEQRLIMTPTGNRVITLPTSEVKAGEIIEIHNLAASQIITVEASGGVDIVNYANHACRFIAKQDTPTADTHWRVEPVGGEYIQGLKEIWVRKGLEIGDWNMDNTAFVNVVHDLDFAKIRWVGVTIRQDDDLTHWDLNISAVGGGDIRLTSVNIQISRDTSGAFDSVTFDSTSFNRGWVSIVYAT